MPPLGLTSNDTHDIDFPPVLYCITQNNAVWRPNHGTIIVIPAPDSNAVQLHELSDFEFCASVKNSLDPSPSGILARKAHTMKNFIVLYSSREFAIERAKEKKGMKVLMIDPKDVISSGFGESTPALYRLDDLIDLFEKTHLSEFRIHWEVEYYVDEAGCYLAFDHIVGKWGDAGVTTYPDQCDNHDRKFFLFLFLYQRTTSSCLLSTNHKRPQNRATTSAAPCYRNAPGDRISICTAKEAALNSRPETTWKILLFQGSPLRRSRRLPHQSHHNKWTFERVF